MQTVPVIDYFHYRSRPLRPRLPRFRCLHIIVFSPVQTPSPAWREPSERSPPPSLNSRSQMGLIFMLSSQLSTMLVEAKASKAPQGLGIGQAPKQKDIHRLTIWNAWFSRGGEMGPVCSGGCSGGDSFRLSVSVSVLHYLLGRARYSFTW